MARIIINKNQIQQTKTEFYNGRPINFDKKIGYGFSDNKAMDECVNYFLNKKGFELLNKQQNKPVTATKEEVISKDTKKEKKKQKKDNKSLFKKKGE